MKLTEKDAGTTVHLHAGEVLEIVLAGNPSTGYQWKAIQGQNELLEQQRDWEFKPAGRAPGAGGTLLMRFKAIRQGKTDFRLIYQRPFEPEEPPVKTFEVKLVVE